VTIAVEAGVHAIVVARTILRIIVVTGAHRKKEIIRMLLWTSIALVTTTAVSINLTSVQGKGGRGRTTGLITVCSIARSTPAANTVKRKGRSTTAIAAMIQVRITRTTTPSTPSSILATLAKVIIVVKLQAITAASVGRIPRRRYQSNIQASTAAIRDTITRRL